jgi:hypothetical protein
VGVFYTGRVRGVDVLCDLCEAIKNWDRSVTFLHKHLLLSKLPHCRYRCVCPTIVLPARFGPLYIGAIKMFEWLRWAWNFNNFGVLLELSSWLRFCSNFFCFNF